MAASLFQAVVSALSKTALISDDIPVAAANLIEVQVKSSHPEADPARLPAQKNGKHMSEGEFYFKAAGASLVPKAGIALALGGAAAGLGVIGLSGGLTVLLVPLALWICGKSAEKEEGEENAGGQEKKHSEYKPSLIDRIMEMTPAKKFLDRLPNGHRRILGQTIAMDIALEMEMMTLAAVALGASGLAATGIVGVVATVAIVPIVALTATTIVWSAAYGVRKLRHLIGRNQKDIDSGKRQEKRLDKILKTVDSNIEPALGLVGKLALMAIGGELLMDIAVIPFAQTVIPHLPAAIVPVMHNALHVFETLPGIAKLALCAPVGYGVGRFVYNPLIVPAMSAVRNAVGKVFKRGKKKASPKKEGPKPVPAPWVKPEPIGRVRRLGRLRPSFPKRNKKSASPAQGAKDTQAKPAIPKRKI